VGLKGHKTAWAEWETKSQAGLEPREIPRPGKGKRPRRSARGSERAKGLGGRKKIVKETGKVSPTLGDNLAAKERTPAQGGNGMGQEEWAPAMWAWIGRIPPDQGEKAEGGAKRTEIIGKKKGEERVPTTIKC